MQARLGCLDQSRAFGCWTVSPKSRNHSSLSRSSELPVSIKRQRLSTRWLRLGYPVEGMAARTEFAHDGAIENGPQLPDGNGREQCHKPGCAGKCAGIGFFLASRVTNFAAKALTCSNTSRSTATPNRLKGIGGLAGAPFWPAGGASGVGSGKRVSTSLPKYTSLDAKMDANCAESKVGILQANREIIGFV